MIRVKRSGTKLRGAYLISVQSSRESGCIKAPYVPFNIAQSGPKIRFNSIVPIRISSVAPRRFGVQLRVHILVRGTVRAEMFPHFVLLATLYVVSQPQPRFCHIEENHLVRKVIDYLSQPGAGFGIRSVPVNIVHKSLSNLPITRHLNAAPNRLFPIS
jgi:hypothetical protein